MSKKTKKPSVKPITDLTNELTKKTVTGPKSLILTPQIAVSIQGLAPEQELFIERPNASGTRHKVRLTPATAYQVLFEILLEKQAEIELERTQREAAKAKASRPRTQPDWRLIAKHPEVVIIERLATRSPELRSLKSDQTLEEMGL